MKTELSAKSKPRTPNSPMNFKLVAADAADRAYLLRLRKLTMVEHLEQAGLYLSDDEHQYRLDDAYDCSYLILLSDKKAGTLKYRELENSIEVMQLQIHPDYQGQGLGKRVMEEVLQWSQHKNKAVELTVLKANPAKRLYQRLGFVISGEDEYEWQLQSVK